MRIAGYLLERGAFDECSEALALLTNVEIRGFWNPPDRLVQMRLSMLGTYFLCVIIESIGSPSRDAVS